MSLPASINCTPSALTDSLAFLFPNLCVVAVALSPRLHWIANLARICGDLMTMPCAWVSAKLLVLCNSIGWKHSNWNIQCMWMIHRVCSGTGVALVLPKARVFATTRYAAFQCPISKRNVHLHVFVMSDKPKGMVIDHIDGNTWNNQKANLRFTTQQQNVWRKKKMKNKKTGFIGVFQKSNVRFVAKINVNRKRQVLGSYATAASAVEAYDEACMRTRGSYAMVNNVK